MRALTVVRAVLGSALRCAPAAILGAVLLAVAAGLFPAGVEAQTVQRSAATFAPVVDPTGSGERAQFIALRYSSWQVPIIPDVECGACTPDGETEVRSYAAQFMMQGRPGRYFGVTLGVEKQGACEETVGCVDTFLAGLSGYLSLFDLGGGEDGDAPRAYLAVHGSMNTGNQLGESTIRDQWAALFASVPVGAAIGGGEGFGFSAYLAPGFSLGTQRYRSGRQTDVVLAGGATLHLPRGFGIQISGKHILSEDAPVRSGEGHLDWSQGKSLDLALTWR